VDNFVDIHHGSEGVAEPNRRSSYRESAPWAVEAKAAGEQESERTQGA
jgi:hypothetical protein